MVQASARPKIVTLIVLAVFFKEFLVQDSAAGLVLIQRLHAPYPCAAAHANDDEKEEEEEEEDDAEEDAIKEEDVEEEEDEEEEEEEAEE